MEIKAGLGTSTYRWLSDIGMTLEGDLMIDSSGDLALVDGWEWLYREINKRIRTDNPAWRNHADIGCSLSDFKGQPNTPEVAKEIRRRVKSVLSIDNIAYPGEIDVDVIPVDNSSIAIHITVRISGSIIDLQKLIYNYSNGVVQDMNEQPTIVIGSPKESKYIRLAKQDDTIVNNKYQSIIDKQN
jgi:hypothetical protein